MVTAQDGVTTRIYFSSILEDVGYLAYVLSDVYTVDQDQLRILQVRVLYPISINTMVSTFMAI